MSIETIKVLSNNSHFSALLLQSFLSGYEKYCDMAMIGIVLPILFNGNTRKKLERANINSSVNSLFLYPQQGAQLSGQANLAGFWIRYEMLAKNTKHAIIILSSEDKIELRKNYVALKQKIQYEGYSGSVRLWLRCAYYLGVVLNKASNEEIIDLLRG